MEIYFSDFVTVKLNSFFKSLFLIVFGIGRTFLFRNTTLSRSAAIALMKSLALLKKKKLGILYGIEKSCGRIITT